MGQESGFEKIMTSYVFLQPLKPAASNLVYKLGLGLAYQKTTFWTKIGGGPGQESIQKMWDPYVFLQPLKSATSNLVHKLGLGLAYQKTTFWTKIGGGLLGRLPIFATVKLATEKLVHNMSSGLLCQKQVSK